jgi:ABC-type spermidine/putrescine transport system permease subunit I
VTWEQFRALEPEWLVVSFAVLAIMIAIAAYVISKIRAETLQREPPASELLSKFREMHSRGVLTDAEFRTIKTALAEQLQKELNDISERG